MLLDCGRRSYIVKKSDVLAENYNQIKANALIFARAIEACADT